MKFNWKSGSKLSEVCCQLQIVEVMIVYVLAASRRSEVLLAIYGSLSKSRPADVCRRRLILPVERFPETSAKGGTLQH